jgi:hypothetical protein
MKARQTFIAIILSTTLATTATADPNKALPLCDAALTACEERVKIMGDMLAAESELRRKVTEQRDVAVNRLDSTSSIPWYVWTIVGVAGGVILTRGLR